MSAITLEAAKLRWSAMRVAIGLVLLGWAVMFTTLWLTGRTYLYLSSRTAWLVESLTLMDGAGDVVDRTAAAGHSALHPWDPIVDAALISRAHAAGLAVNAWTCDDPVRMRQLIGWGIDGICTNVPDVGVAVRAGTHTSGG